MLGIRNISSQIESDIMKVIDFKVVVSSNPSVFEREVRDLIKEGWELRGEIFLWAGNFCQTMILQ